jgi:hypothetical protein
MESRDDVDFMAEGRVKVATAARMAATGHRVIVPTIRALISATVARAARGFGPDPMADDRPGRYPPPGLGSQRVGATASDSATADDPLTAATSPMSPTPAPIEQATTMTVVIARWPCPVGMKRARIR